MTLKQPLLVIFSALITTTAFAGINASHGFYIGADAVTSDYSAVPGSAFNNQLFPINNGYFRPFAGFRFNDYFAVEGSYNDIEDSKSNGGNFWGPDHYRLYSYDLAGKLIAPFKNNFSLFGKAGVAYTHQDVFNQTFTNGPIMANTNTNVVQPLLGIGVNYNFTPKIAADVGFTHLFKHGSIGDINMLGMGLSYTFGGN